MEETFINTVVAPAFYPLKINLVAQLIETSVGHKGGALRYERVEKHLRNNLRRLSQSVVTTLIDLYKLDSGFPGYAAAQGKPLETRLQVLNAAFHAQVVAAAGCRADQFLPYIQPYEFEALLFSGVEELTRLETGWAGATAELQKARDAFLSPEYINDGPTTKLVARLENHLKYPPYRKVLHGSPAAERITLDKIAAQCQFFSGWLDQLGALKSLP